MQDEKTHTPTTYVKIYRRSIQYNITKRLSFTSKADDRAVNDKELRVLLSLQL